MHSRIERNYIFRRSFPLKILNVNDKYSYSFRVTYEFLYVQIVNSQASNPIPSFRMMKIRACSSPIHRNGRISSLYTFENKFAFPSADVCKIPLSLNVRVSKFISLEYSRASELVSSSIMLMKFLAGYNKEVNLRLTDFTSKMNTRIKRCLLPFRHVLISSKCIYRNENRSAWLLEKPILSRCITVELVRSKRYLETLQERS